MATDPRSGVTILEAHTCWMLLRSSEVGRLAVSVADHPDIFPIN
jgi:nitroimidazol reductase NimA-like FMN-containing flavoprotein (pyridoxamine 5'-phosphate oxidase superfamily)